MEADTSGYSAYSRPCGMYKVGSWSAGFTKKLYLIDDSAIERTKHLGFIAPNIEDESCLKREQPNSTTATSIIDYSYLLNSEYDTISPTFAACSDCSITESNVMVADLQLDKLYSVQSQCSPTNVSLITKVSDPVIYYVGEPELVLPFEFSALLEACLDDSKSEKVLNVWPPTLAIKLKPNLDAISVFTNDKDDSVYGSPGISPVDYKVYVSLLDKDSGFLYDSAEWRQSFTVRIGIDPCSEPNSQHKDCIDPADFKTDQFNIPFKPYFNLNERESNKFIIPVGNNWLWTLPEPSHEDVAKEHSYSIDCNIEPKADFISFNKDTRIFSIARKGTQEKDIGKYAITLTL